MPRDTEYEHKTEGTPRVLLRTLYEQAVHGIDGARTRLSSAFRTVREGAARLARRYACTSDSVFMGVAALFAALGHLPEGVYPFGTALLAALTDRSAMTAAWIGSSVGALFCGEGRFMMIAVYFLLYVTRKAFTNSTFGEKRGIRLLESGLGAVLMGVIRVFVGREARSYAVITSLAAVIVSVGAAYLFSALFDPRTAAGTAVSVRCAAAYVFVGMLVTAVQGVTVFGLRADAVAACLLTMLYAASGGFMHAGIVGFVCGLACGEPVLCASLGLSGIVCALLYTKNAAAAFVSFAICMFGCGIYGGSVGQALLTLPEVLLAAMLFGPAIGVFPRVLKPDTARGTGVSLPPPSERSSFRERLTDALLSASDLFEKLSSKRRLPSETDVGVSVTKAFADVCAGCALSEMCFAKKQTDADALTRELHAVLAARPVTDADLGEPMRDKCIRLDALCERINRLYLTEAERCAGDDRPALLASNYASMARMVAELDGKEHAAAGRDRVFEKAVAKALTEADIPFASVTVRSERDKRTTVRGVDPSKVPFGTQELIRYLYTSCGIRVGDIAFDIAADGTTSLTFTRAPFIRFEYAGASKKRDGEDVCGDTVSLFEGTRSRMYALLCDGMGSGRDAAAASRLCASFLEKLCASEISRPLMLEMLNNALLSQSGEHFSTVDLMEADLLTGRCTFIKAGAAPTYILRGTRLYKIASETPPVGILPSFTAESTRFDVRPGDLILMVSDGVLTDKETRDITEGDGVGELAWLAELMHAPLPADPALIAEKLLENAGAFPAADDRTAAVIRVYEAKT